VIATVPGVRAYSGPESALIVDNPLTPQLLEKLADVAPNFGRVGHAELGLQFCDDLGESALTVAALEYLASGALQLDRALREQDYAFFARFTLSTPAATGGQSGLAGIFWRRHASVRPLVLGAARKSRFLHFALRLMKPIAMLRSE